MVSPELTTDAGVGSGASSTHDRKWVYVVLVLTFTYILNFVDRQIVNILAEPIKIDLKLHDWQLGILTGLAFSLMYGVTALPIARFAERHSRPRLIASALSLWSAATLACSFAANFGQLAAARVAVGVSESGYTPAAYSLMADAVPQRRRTLAFGIFSAGQLSGAMIAMALGGIIADRYGWRAAFLVAGVPGFVMALLILLTIADPRVKQGRPSTSADLGADFRVLWGKRSYRLFVIAGGFIAMTAYGIQAFVASFFLRNHAGQLATLTGTVNATVGTHFGNTAIVGPALGLIVGITGLVSSLLIGIVTDRLVKRDPRHFGSMAAWPLIVTAPALAAGLYWPGLEGSLFWVAVYFFFNAMTAPVWIAGLQTLAPPAMRATASALALLALVVFGNGLGPFLIGLISDVASRTGLSSGDGLRVAMLVGVIPNLVAAAIFLLSRRHFGKEAGERWAIEASGAA